MNPEKQLKDVAADGIFLVLFLSDKFKRKREKERRKKRGKREEKRGSMMASQFTKIPLFYIEY